MRLFFAAFLILILFLGLSCNSGIGTESPSRPIENSAQDPSCNKEISLKHLRSTLDQKKLTVIGPLLEDILFAQGAFKTVSRLMLSMVRQVETETLNQTLANYENGAGLARLSLTAVSVLNYSDGDRSQTPADNYRFFHTFSQFMSDCSAHDAVALLRTALAIEYVTNDGQTQSWLDVFLDQLANVMTDPGLPSLLDRIQLQDDSETTTQADLTDEADDNADILLGRDAFILLIDLVLGNLSSPDVDIDYFRTTMEELLLPQISDEGTLKNNIVELLDITFFALNSDPFLMPYLQSSTQCLQQTDPEKTLGHFIYDLLTLGFINIEDTVEQIRLLKEDQAGEALLEVIITTLDILYLDQGLARDVFQSTSSILKQENLEILAPQLVALQGSGLIADISGVLHFFFETCTTTESDL